ncbi:tRNA(fMet)-specific endonuclease VapC [Rhodobacteraceae bacterium THAF1]|uniref:type II toxin-antitoxin system VapC family toxin n=1 Tax=Palleronia sp. THAF1 TaxID=2587842 RepID=UPI000F3F3FF7|nr:type II toxin-antitoxin system VapC family toxin [Palleronia sp. THAF1]QFU10375.1 tRNA(fMet)-specific endonuclease VapC [Palleronia sp. THAF1]VDC31403.1 tRNA(fMet)-specific endonuclease VapC [Rhodobacteraceae bacterium THAF1]
MTLPERIVVDASVALKWIIEEDGSAEAARLRSCNMAAPALLRIETANVLRTLAAKGAIDSASAADLFALLQDAPVTIVDADDALEARALELAVRLGHPVYDCVYLALAERTDRTLITADKRFLRALAGSAPVASALNLTDLQQD